jgi:hypothetical protein
MGFDLRPRQPLQDAGLEPASWRKPTIRHLCFARKQHFVTDPNASSGLCLYQLMDQSAKGDGGLAADLLQLASRRVQEFLVAPRCRRLRQEAICMSGLVELDA